MLMLCLVLALVLWSTALGLFTRFVWVTPTKKNPDDHLLVQLITAASQTTAIKDKDASHY